jgi:hypothetical protein
MLTVEESIFIRNSIKQLKDDFLEHPNKFLTEDDVRFHLCCLLMDMFGRLVLTEDGDKSIALHTEVRWYGGERNLKFRSDIVIIDVKTLVVKKKAGLEIPSKGYGFNMPKAIIELKLRRLNGSSDRAYKEKVEADCKKLEDLRYIMRERSGGKDIYCCTVALDKKGRLKDFNDYENVDLVYASVQ